MPNTISAFAAQMKEHGFARPNIFEVKVHGPTTPDGLQKFQHSCFQAQIPGNNILTTDKDIGFRSVAYQKAFGDIILGFYVTGDLRELRFWQQWIDNIVDKRTNHYRYYNHYAKGSIEITQLSRTGAKIATWELKEAYPKQVDPIQLDYGTNDAVMTCNVTITYRYFEVDWSPSQHNEAGQPIASHSVKTDMANDVMAEIRDPNERWKFGNNGITEKDFYASYPTWSDMNQTQRQAAFKVYGIDRHGFSPTGGASQMVNEVDQEEF